MYKMKEYTNELKNTYFERMHVMDIKKMLYPVEMQNCEIVIDSFKKVLSDYSDYIEDEEKVIELFSKIETLRYINVGMFTEDKWKFNKHIFVINGLNFEYKTGTGINTKSNKSNSYNYYKLILDAIYCFLQDASYNYMSEDDFLEELGYTESIESFRKGQKAYRECKETYDKCNKIWGRNTIENLYDIINL